jgi:hypothetical protein
VESSVAETAVARLELCALHRGKTSPGAFKGRFSRGGRQCAAERTRSDGWGRVREGGGDDPYFANCCRNDQIAATGGGAFAS